MISVLSVAVLASALVAPPPFFASSPATSAPAQCSAAPVEQAPVAKAKKPKLPSGITTKSMCTAYCGDLNGTVSCTGSVCSSVDQDQTCPVGGGPGHVTCDGTTTYCPACCTDGAIRNVTTGPICSCADGMTTPKDQYKCFNGLWEYQTSFCGGPFCHG